MTPAEFLTARLDEMEADCWWHTTECGWALTEGMAEDCTCKVPDVILADIAAKRAILAEWAAQRVKLLRFALGDDPDTSVAFVQTEGAIAALAKATHHFCRPFADHPDYNPSWRRS